MTLYCLRSSKMPCTRICCHSAGVGTGRVKGQWAVAQYSAAGKQEHSAKAAYRGLTHSFGSCSVGDFPVIESQKYTTVPGAQNAMMVQPNDHILIRGSYSNIQQYAGQNYTYWCTSIYYHTQIPGPSTYRTRQVFQDTCVQAKMLEVLAKNQVLNSLT